VLAVPICVQPCTDRNNHEIILASLNGLTVPSTRVLAHAATDPSFQVDGRRVVFHSLAASQTGRAEGIFISDLPSDTEIRVDGTPDDYWPIFINHGWVLFSSTRVEVNQKKEYRLFIATRYNSEDAPQGVGPDPIVALKDARFPSYFPGGLIAYSGCVGGGCGIWTTTERGYAPSDACCQVSRGASDTAPDWSPDGARIAFSSREDGNFEIYVINANGTGRTRLTHTAGTNVAPAWSPDGHWIAYLSDRSGSWAVWLVRPDRPDQTVKLFDIQGTIDDAPNRRMDWVASP